MNLQKLVSDNSRSIVDVIIPVEEIFADNELILQKLRGF